MKHRNGRVTGATSFSGTPQTLLALIPYFESIEGELRETLYAHDRIVGRSTLSDLRTLAEQATPSAMGLQQAAQALLNLLEYKVGRVPITSDRNQIVLLLDRLWRQIRPSADDAPSALDRKTALSRRHSRQPVGLFLDREATTCLLQEVVSASGYCVENICGLTNAVIHARSDRPVSIISDLSLLRDDAQIRDRVEQWRKTYPKARLFCQSASTHFAARLEAVRFGASRFLIKPLNVDKLIALLESVAVRKDGEPFHALLVDDGRALTALQADATLNVVTCGPLLYPEVMVSDVYMTRCSSFQAGVGTLPLVEGIAVAAR